MSYHKRIRYRGSFGEYFLKSLLLLILSAITLGLAAPYAAYWSLKYFFTELEIDGQPVRYTGNFVEYFFVSLALMILSVVTLGIAFPYWVYWSFKYFFDRLNVGEPHATTASRPRA